MLPPPQNPDLTASSSITSRLFVLGALLTVEWLAVEQVPHTWMRPGRSSVPIAFTVALLFFARKRIRNESLTPPPDRWFVALHIFIACLCGVAAWTLRHDVSSPNPLVLLLRHAWMPLLALLSLSAVTAAFPVSVLRRVARALGEAWLYAASIAFSTFGLQRLLRHRWDDPASRIGHLLATPAFYATRFLLAHMYPKVLSNPATWALGTPSFQVVVAGACSGVQGLALMFALALGWIIYLRRELRMHRALWIVPICLATVWLLNIVRLAALIAIGNAGHPAIALTGFHSQAGWIFFNLTAVTLLVTAQRWTWIRTANIAPGHLSHPGVLPASDNIFPGTRNVAAIYLAPFLAIVAAGLLAGAVSSGFDWLYPLRLAAASAVLWLFRDDYRRMDLRFDWLGPVAGLIIGGLWIVLAHLFAPSATPLAAGLARLTTHGRIAWIVCRVLAAVLTVPIAEELAFRGFLARCLTTSDPEALPYARLTPVAIIVSSALFAWMHGRMWPAGFLAGLTFALVARYRNRLGEAVAAHAVANAVLAAYVLARGDLSLW